MPPRRHTSMRRQTTLAIVAAVVVLLNACGSGPATEPTPTTRPVSPSPSPPASPSEQAAAYSTYPDAIAVIGHSGSTGENSDPKQPGVEVRENSWATGSNPKVNSVYRRILAKHPQIKGNNYNLGRGGATVRDMAALAGSLAQFSPKPQLVLIQIGDNDIECPATTQSYQDFASNLVRALTNIERAVPGAKFFVVTQVGRPERYVKALSLKERRSIGGDRPCDIADPQGRLVPKEIARLTTIIQGYEAQLKAACERFAQCRYDDGAFGRIVDSRKYLSSDLNHLSIEGHAKVASVAWAALKRAGLIPKSA